MIAHVQDNPHIEDGSQSESHFGIAFKKLSLTSQKKFFIQVSKKSNLSTALKHIPKDITKLAFRPDHCAFYDTPKDFILPFAQNLNQFRDLKKIEIDLSAITCLTKKIKSFFINRSFVNATVRLNASDNLNIEEVNMGGPNLVHSHTHPAKAAIRAGIDYLENINGNTEISFKFINSCVVDLSKSGSESKITATLFNGNTTGHLLLNN